MGAEMRKFQAKYAAQYLPSAPDENLRKYLDGVVGLLTAVKGTGKEKVNAGS